MYVCVYTRLHFIHNFGPRGERKIDAKLRLHARVLSIFRWYTYIYASFVFLFSALVSYSNDCNLKYFSLYRMREDWNLKKFMTRCILISATFHNSQIPEKGITSYAKFIPNEIKRFVIIFPKKNNYLLFRYTIFVIVFDRCICRYKILQDFTRRSWSWGKKIFV